MTTTVRVDAPSTATRSLPRTRTGALSWTRRYAILVTLGDVLALAIALTITHVVLVVAAPTAANPPAGVLTPLQVDLAAAVLWLLTLRLLDTRGTRILGSGSTEYKRVVDAAILSFGLFLLGVFALDLDVSRLDTFLVFPLATAALVGNRWICRQWLVSRRRRGEFASRVVLIGSQRSVRNTARDLIANPEYGFRVVGVSLTDGPDGGTLPGTDLPIVGGVDDVPSLLDLYRADTVIATSSDHLPAERVRELSWKLDPRRHQLVVAPSITDVAGSRVHLRPVAGLPLLHVETPQYEGPQRVAKRIFDVAMSGLAVLALLPLFAGVAMLIRRTDAGPVFYTQERIGRDGEPFRIFKFRSMYVDSDARRAELVAASGRKLFKMEDDPRVTPIGKILRKFSIDELPQLLNVLRGDMSLVGPRPALAEEVSDYSSSERRRLVVTPGMSGLWQVSGRSNLSWDDGIRLDLYYADNWSMTGDLIILFRTARAVFAPEGAY